MPPEESRNLESPFCPQFRLEAVVLSGIQGAGKSTFCRQHYTDTHIRINYDMLRTRHREGILLAACIAARQPFVVDATNPTPADRARYLAPAALAGFYRIGIEFVIPLVEALARNAQRTGKALVPEKAIRVTCNRLEPLSYAEGFDEIWQAQVSEAGVVLSKVQREGLQNDKIVTHL